jgi:hypothetical protein
MIMKKFFNILLLIVLIVPIVACKTIKDGFESQRKNSTEEFLVEKKKPLVMPPDYNELPVPITNENKKDLEESEIKNLLMGDTNKKENTNSNNVENKNIEKSILKKIKDN